MIITLPVPPSTNALFATVGKIRVKSRAYKTWIKQADGYYFSQVSKIKPVSGPYSLVIKIPKATRGDCDNRSKAAIDFLVSRKITPDDRHCQAVSIERADVLECEIEITSCETWNDLWSKPFRAGEGAA